MNAAVAPVTGRRVVCVLTGHGLKDVETAASATVPPLEVGAGLDALRAVVRG